MQCTHKIDIYNNWRMLAAEIFRVIKNKTATLMNYFSHKNFTNTTWMSQQNWSLQSVITRYVHNLKLSFS